MAGGPNAEQIVCYQCGSKAERTYEGTETDKYACDQGHEFGVNWSHGPIPTEPQWPPSEEVAAFIKENSGR